MNDQASRAKKAVKKARRNGINDALPDVQPPGETKRISEDAKDDDDDEE